MWFLRKLVAARKVKWTSFKNHRAGLPDGLFSNQKSNLGKFSFHLVYFVAIWNIFWSFGIRLLVFVYCIKKGLFSNQKSQFGYILEGYM
jgi:hypothetical protein